MAAFPPPALDLFVPEPLRDLFEYCEQICIADCCGLDAFDISTAHLAGWLTLSGITVAGIALDQFERLTRDIAIHRGTIRADWHHGCFNSVWQAPHDCLTYFGEWRRAIAETVRDIDDPPFFSPNWLIDPVVGLRDAILAERAFDRLPILADALEEAGCDNRVILDHLRADDDHSHMCWVLDVLNAGSGRPVR